MKIKTAFSIILAVFLVASLTYLIYREIDQRKEKSNITSKDHIANEPNWDINNDIIEKASDNMSNDNEANNDNSSQKPIENNFKVVTYLFHKTHRCPSCNTIEDLTTKTLNKYFSAELQKKELEFISINVDEPQNRHYIEDYQLFTISLVIALYDGNREEKWQNLDKVWVYLNDQEKFSQYIMTSIKSYLSESGIE